MSNQRPRLKGYISLDALDEWADDFSHWSGEITYPDPEGANLAWQKTIEMIEVKPNEKVFSREEIRDALENFAENIAIFGNHVDLHDTAINELFGEEKV